jgi:hypothetical protein
MTTELCDLEEIKRAIAILLEPGDVTEVRGLKTPKKTQIGFYNDREKMAWDIASLSGHAAGVYIIPDKVNPDLLARSANQLKPYADSGDGASDKDIISRRLLKIDADPIRASGISSTDSEHDAALVKAFHISGYLNDTLSFPADSMLLADSGNGAHLLIRIDLPNTPESTTLIKKCLKSVAYLFNDERTQIDTSVYNPARIWKAYGTLACKGSDTPDRPHRIAKLLIVPDKVVIAPKESLERLAAIAPDDPKPTQTHTGEKFDLTTWLSSHNINVKRVSKWETWDKYELECCPFDSAHTGSSVCILQNANGAIVFKCMHSGCQGKEWADVRELKEPGYRDVIRINNNSLINMSPKRRVDSKAEQSPEQNGTSLTTKWGEYSERFDEIMREAGGGWQDKKDIAEQLGTTPTDRAFRSLLQRRREAGKLRVHSSRPYLIQWVNKDYTFLTLADYKKQANLSITLPLDLNKHVNVPAGSVIGVAGYTSAGKTAFLLETAELNVTSQDLPVYHWFNEMSSDRMLLRLEDYPLLVIELGRKFKAVKQTDFEFYDVIEPDAINIIDYLDLDGEGENQQVYMIGAVIKKLQRRLGKGIVIFALQKKEASDMGYGGVYSAKLSNLYLSLDTVKQEDTRMMGKCKIVKAKDWSEVNPVGLYCNYYTGGKHGKIMSDNVWRRE